MTSRLGNRSYNCGHLALPHRDVSEALEPTGSYNVATRAYPGFCTMKQLGIFLLPLDKMLVHCMSLPSNFLGFPNNSLVLIYTPGWRETLRVQCLGQEHNTVFGPGLEPVLLDPGMSALTTRTPHLHLIEIQIMYENRSFFVLGLCNEWRSTAWWKDSQIICIHDG